MDIKAKSCSIPNKQQISLRTVAQGHTKAFSLLSVPPSGPTGHREERKPWVNSMTTLLLAA